MLGRTDTARRHPQRPAGVIRHGQKAAGWLISITFSSLTKQTFLQPCQRPPAAAAALMQGHRQAGLYRGEEMGGRGVRSNVCGQAVDMGEGRER